MPLFFFSWIDVVIVLAGAWLLWRLYRTYASVDRIDPEEVRKLLERHSEVEIVDVRTRGEFDAWHIPGAKSIPIHELQLEPEHHAARLNREATLVVVCETGSRSVHAYHTLKRLGFERVYNMHGGMISWRGPVVKRSDN